MGQAYSRYEVLFATFVTDELWRDRNSATFADDHLRKLHVGPENSLLFEGIR